MVKKLKRVQIGRVLTGADVEQAVLKAEVGNKNTVEDFQSNTVTKEDVKEDHILETLPNDANTAEAALKECKDTNFSSKRSKTEISNTIDYSAVWVESTSKAKIFFPFLLWDKDRKRTKQHIAFFNQELAVLFDKLVVDIRINELTNLPKNSKLQVDKFKRNDLINLLLIDFLENSELHCLDRYLVAHRGSKRQPNIKEESSIYNFSSNKMEFLKPMKIQDLNTKQMNFFIPVPISNVFEEMLEALSKKLGFEKKREYLTPQIVLNLLAIDAIENNIVPKSLLRYIKACS